MSGDARSADRAIEPVLAAAGYSLERRLPGGIHGAWLVFDGRGGRAVLKCAWDVDCRARLADAARVVELLAARGAPVPRYLHVGYESEIGTWYVQEQLPGERVERLTHTLADAVVELNALQAGLGAELEDTHDLSVEATGRLRDASAPAAAPDELTSLLDELRPIELSSDDVVHGDLVATNLLADGGRLTGVVDWDAAGRGDRAHDLALLFYNVFAQADRLGDRPEHVVSALGRAAIEACGAERFGAFLAYEALDALRFVSEHNQKHVAWRADLARRSIAAYRLLRHSIE